MIKKLADYNKEIIMNKKKIHNNSNDFWKQYSQREDLTLNSLMNLEANAEKSKTKFIYEKKRLESIIEYNSKWSLVDLGGGVGLWSEYFSEQINKVTLVEREEKFIELARSVYKGNDQRAKIKLEINNFLGSNIKEVKSHF